jgi:hypothetical protein
MTRSPRHGFSLLAALAVVIPLSAGSVIATAAQPDDRPRNRQDSSQTPRGERPPLSSEELAARLRDRLADLDAMRERLASTVERLDAGESFEEIFTPEDRRRFMRSMRERDGDGWTGLFDRPGMEPGNERRGGPPEGRLPGGGPADDMRDRDRDDRGPWGRGRPEPLTDAQLAEVRAIIDEHIPTLAQRLKAAEENEPEAADRFLARIAPRFRDILELKEHAPELVEVRIDELRTGMAIVAAARDLRRLDAEQPGSQAFTDKKEEIRGLLVRQFDLRQQLERHRIERQIAEMQSALSRLAEQTRDRTEVIDGHLDRVVSRALNADRDGDERRGRRRDEDAGDRDD